MSVALPSTVLIVSSALPIETVSLYKHLQSSFCPVLSCWMRLSVLFTVATVQTRAVWCRVECKARGLSLEASLSPQCTHRRAHFTCDGGAFLATNQQRQFLSLGCRMALSCHSRRGEGAVPALCRSRVCAPDSLVGNKTALATRGGAVE